MTSEEILDELAAQTDDIREFEGVTFEVLEDWWAIADARLSAFSSDKMWAVAIEVVGYDRGNQYSLRVYLFGNCIKAREDAYRGNFERVLLTTPKAWNKEIEKNQIWGIARDGFAFRWRGKRFDFAPSLEELKAAGIELSRRELESGELSPQQMLRYVCEKLDHPFFLSEDGLRDLLDKNSIPFKWEYDKETERSWYESELGEFDEPPIPSLYLELLLQTRDWTHPKVGLADADAGDWEISPREAFAALAQTLATRDLAVWNAQDASKFNSHWRNWAEIEAEKEREQLEAIAGGRAAFRAWVEKLPNENRAEFLTEFRSTIETLPSISGGGGFAFMEFEHTDATRLDAGLSVGGSAFMESEHGTIQIFRELLPEVDAMLAELETARDEPEA